MTLSFFVFFRLFLLWQCPRSVMVQQASPRWRSHARHARHALGLQQLELASSDAQFVLCRRNRGARDRRMALLKLGPDALAQRGSVRRRLRAQRT